MKKLTLKKKIVLFSMNFKKNKFVIVQKKLYKRLMHHFTII